MPVTTVSWRQTLAAVIATVLALGVLVLVARSDGLPAVEAASSRATRWFVHQPTGRVVLVDGYGGRALASLEAAPPGNRLLVAESGNQVYALDDTTAVKPSFTPDLTGDYLLRLVVTDSRGAKSDPDEVLVSTYNTAPVADAGED